MNEIRYCLPWTNSFAIHTDRTVSGRTRFASPVRGCICSQSMRASTTLPEPKVPGTLGRNPVSASSSWGGRFSPAEGSLNNDLLLLRVHSALRRLSRHCNHRFPCRQRWCEVMERPVGRKHRNLPSIHHYPCSHLSLPSHFNNMSVLNKRVQVQLNGFRLRSLGNYGETVFLALHRYFPRRIIGLYGPVVCPFAQACNGNIGCIYLSVNQGRRAIGVSRDPQPIACCVRHRRPGKFHILGRLPRGKDRGHVRRRYGRRGSSSLFLFHVGLCRLEAHLFPVRQLHRFSIARNLAGALLHQDLVLIGFGIVVYLRRRIRRQRCCCPRHDYLRFRSLRISRRRKIHSSSAYRHGYIRLLLIVG